MTMRASAPSSAISCSLRSLNRTVFCPMVILPMSSRAVSARNPAATATSEQRALALDAAHGVVVQYHAADAPVDGEGAGLRPDLLGGEDAQHRREQRVPVQQL